MLTGNATEQPRTSFRGESPRLAAAKPSNQACGECSPGFSPSNCLSSHSPASIDLALDSISATELEREVVHLVCRVNSPRSALRVVAEYRAAKQEETQPMVRL